ncbi:MAG: rhomboid family intramembrane serine protease [Pseudomonadota bacterium]
MGSRFPRTATNIIVAVTVIAWIIAIVLGRANQAAYSLGFLAIRVSLTALPFPAVPVFLTPLTATLVHSNLVHLGFNMLILLWCGSQVERVIGWAGLIVLYVVGAYAAAAAQWALDPLASVPVIGASGAISAIIGAYALSFGRARAFTNNLRVNRWINVVWLMIAWAVLQAMMGWLGNQQGYLLATPAHVGGFAAGLLLQRPLLLWRYRKA